MNISLFLTSAGRRSHLLQCFRESAGTLGLDLRVIASDLYPNLSAACQQADEARVVPPCTSVDYVPALLAICQERRVGLLVPTIDTELEALSCHAAEFAAIGTRVVVSHPKIVALARDKLRTMDCLSAAGIATPRTVLLSSFRRDPQAWPGGFIAKPIRGSSSVGIVLGSKPEDFATLPAESYLVQERWIGAEYTVNVFFDQDGRLCCAVPHRRIEVRGGEVSKGRTERVPQLEEAAQRLAAALPGARGPLCFQAIVRESGEYAVFEINARFGGGYPLAHQAGARFSQWLLEEAIGRPCSAHNNWRAGVKMLRYDAAVFIDD